MNGSPRAWPEVGPSRSGSGRVQAAGCCVKSMAGAATPRTSVALTISNYRYLVSPDMDHVSIAATWATLAVTIRQGLHNGVI